MRKNHKLQITNYKTKITIYFINMVMGVFFVPQFTYRRFGLVFVNLALDGLSGPKYESSKDEYLEVRAKCVNEAVIAP